MRNFAGKIVGILGNGLARNVLTLMTGATISQAIPIAVMPILTRLYSPEEFGVFALYISIVSILSVCVTARYELAIMLPTEEQDAASIVVLSFAIAFGISAVLAALLFIFEDVIVRLLGNSEIRPWLYLVPATVLLMGLYQAMSIWTSRKKHFRQLAYCRVTESGTTACTQLLLYALIRSGGLIVGNFIGKLAATVVLTLSMLRHDKEAFLGVTKDQIFRNARTYAKFPTYSVGGALLDSAASQLPVILISKFFNAATTGMFSLSFRVLSLPITLISSAISPVLFQRVAELETSNPERLRPFIAKLFFLLLGIVSPLIVLMWLAGESLFDLVFGSEWKMAGELAAWLSIAVSVRFAVSPLSAVLYLEKNLSLGALWQVAYFVTSLCTMMAFHDSAIKTFVVAFVVNDLVLYLFYFYLILKGAKSSPS